eukprot:tig00000037_g10069.t1
MTAAGSTRGGSLACRKPEEIIKLDANENPYGPSPKVREVLAAAPYLHIYPDPESRELRAALAEETGVAEDHILCGNGADELIDLMFRAYVDPNDAVVNTPPTFGMYKFDGDVSGARVLNVWRGADFSVDVDGIERLFFGPDAVRPHPKLVFVTSPNNPDGSLLSDADLERLLALPAIIVLDEAYVEFQGGCIPGQRPRLAGQSRMPWVTRHENLVVLRTFSKMAGLAGMRIGYGAFPLHVAEHLWKIKQPYNVTVASQLAAVASLQDLDFLLENLSRMVAAREQLAAGLAALPFLAPFPSSSNFVLARVLPNHMGLTAADVKKRLEDLGILIRYYNSTGLADCVRFSVGTPEQIAVLLSALKDMHP